MKTTMNEIYQWLGDQSKTAAESWFRLQCANPFASFYLYYRQGELLVEQDCPDGFELGDGQRLGPGGTIEQIQARIYNRARLLPILPEALTK